MATENRDIKYLNKDFGELRATLIDFAKTYFPTTYNDFTPASPGMMFMEMSAYVGDVLSFYLDNQIQENFLQFAKDSLKSNPRKDTLDIVCHSMGYAYMLGFLTQVDSIYNLGKILIIAPETPDFMGYDWNKFQEVWQYGSNLGEKKADVICMQDGIAPQGPVKNLENLAKEKGGRVFVPKHASRGFIFSHHLNWFDWFYTIHPGDYGFFTR